MAKGIPTYRPLITGNTHMVSAGHYLATAAGYRILEQGGNATDAGVATGIAINVVLPQFTSFGGVAPIIIHDAGSRPALGTIAPRPPIPPPPRGELLRRRVPLSRLQSRAHRAAIA